MPTSWPAFSNATSTRMLPWRRFAGSVSWWASSSPLGNPVPRLGRRVCAAATRRGVLLRPIGDVVVLMPPLTSTAAELEIMVEALVSALDEVAP